MRQPVDQLARFTRSERWVHWATAALFGGCLLTAACLYVPQLSELVGRRRLIATAHLWTGLLLPAPMVLGWAFAAYRADVRRLNRFNRADWLWLRSRDRRGGRVPVGKFNAGQKLNAAFTAGAILVMLGTGLLMWFPSLVGVQYRTGATFVHDWLAAGIVVVLIGHVWMAARDPMARQGMRTGRVSEGWARREHGQWAAEHARSRAASADAASPTTTTLDLERNGQPHDARAADEGAGEPLATDPDPGLPFFPRDSRRRAVSGDGRSLTQRLPRFPSS